jgi:zinc transport system ATP-binding protein
MIPVIEDVLRWPAVPAESPAHAHRPGSAGGLAVELRGVTFGYAAGRVVLEHVDLAVEDGEFVAIAGPNGGGKTTLVRLALGLEQPNVGTARLLGDPSHRCRRRAEIGYVPQRTQLGGEAPATVREVVAAGRLAGGGLVGPLRRSDRELVDRAVARVGLADRSRSPLRTLSGGMQQRAFIAKALAAEPSLLVLDEPTTGVDAESQESLAALLDELHRELGVTIVYVSHEFGAVERFVQRLVLVRGGVVFDGSPDELPGVWHDPSHRHDNRHHRV